MSEVQELPQGWAPATLGVLGEYINGYPFNDKSWSQNGRPIIRIQNLTGSTKVTNYYDKEIDDKYVVHTGDLLVAWSATLGAFIWRGPEACLNQHIFKVRSYINKLFHYYLIQSVLQNLYQQAHGSGMVHVTRGKFDAIELILPPLPEQQRIVEALEQQLSRLDAGVAALQSAQKKLKRYRASVLKAAIEGKLTEEWRKSHPELEPAPELLKRILQERRAKWEKEQIAKGRDPQKVKYVEPARPNGQELGKLPEGWCWATVEAISIKVVDGVHKKPNYVDNGIPFVTVRNLTAGPTINLEKLHYITREDHFDFCKRANPEHGDILLSKDGTLGVVRLINIDTPFSIFVSVALIKPVYRGTGKYLEIALSSPQVQAQMVPKGSGLQHIHLEDLRVDCTPLPPLAEQEQIVSLVEERLSIVATLESTIEQILKRAERMRQSILHKAFTGQLVVQDSNDEPASMLLERIRRERAEAPQKLKRYVYKEHGRNPNRRVAESMQPYLLMDVAEPEPIDADTTQGELWNETS